MNNTTQEQRFLELKSTVMETTRDFFACQLQLSCTDVYLAYEHRGEGMMPWQ